MPLASPLAIGYIATSWNKILLFQIYSLFAWPTDTCSLWQATVLEITHLNSNPPIFNLRTHALQAQGTIASARNACGTARNKMLNPAPTTLPLDT